MIVNAKGNLNLLWQQAPFVTDSLVRDEKRMVHLKVNTPNSLQIHRPINFPNNFKNSSRQLTQTSP
jgi:hypothetical protein